MQSLIHGNFDGGVRTKVYALVGAAAAIATAVGPLLGGFITTYLSWRVGFLLEAVVIAVVLSGITGSCATCRTPGRAASTSAARSCRCWGWAASCSGSSCGRRAGSRWGRCWRSARSRWRDWCAGSYAASVRGKPSLIDPDLFRSVHFRTGITGQFCSSRSDSAARSSRCRSTCRWCSSTTRWRPDCRSPRSRSPCSRSRSSPGSGWASAGRAASSGAGCTPLSLGPCWWTGPQPSARR